MSGPPYPHPNPAPGSNAIGQFQIGVSPIGTIEAFDFWSTVISQYANSPILTGILAAYNAAIDQTENLDNFYDFIWNVDTAKGYGLDVWGRIVGVSRTLHLPGSIDYLGFNEANSWTGFGQGGFYSGGTVSSNFVLADDDYRTLIYAKAAGNISDGSIENLNSILLGLFPHRGLCYAADNRNMSVTLTFNFPLNPIETAIIELSGVLPIPAGVAVIVSQPA